MCLLGRAWKPVSHTSVEEIFYVFSKRFLLNPFPIYNKSAADAFEIILAYNLENLSN